MNSTNKTYFANAKDGENNKLYNISYNLSKKENNLECACDEGNYPNDFKVKMRNLHTDEDVIITKKCLCNNYFDNLEDKITYDGEPSLIRYMTTDGAPFLS
jgi:hypothetical protein